VRQGPPACQQAAGGAPPRGGPGRVAHVVPHSKPPPSSAHAARPGWRAAPPSGREASGRSYRQLGRRRATRDGQQRQQQQGLRVICCGRALPQQHQQPATAPPAASSVASSRATLVPGSQLSFFFARGGFRGCASGRRRRSRDYYACAALHFRTLISAAWCCVCACGCAPTLHALVCAFAFLISLAGMSLLCSRPPGTTLLLGRRAGYGVGVG
jgi:hypothetical protein